MELDSQTVLAMIPLLLLLATLPAPFLVLPVSHLMNNKSMGRKPTQPLTMHVKKIRMNKA